MLALPFAALTLLSALAAAPAACAQMTPMTPSGVVAGRAATAQWTRDTTGQWTDVTLTLMSGDNFQMVPVTSEWWLERETNETRNAHALLSPPAALATGIDGTSATSYQFTGEFPLLTPLGRVPPDALPSPRHSPRGLALLGHLLSPVPAGGQRKRVRVDYAVLGECLVFPSDLSLSASALSLDRTDTQATPPQISSSDGTATTQPANSVQPNGQAIPWGAWTLLPASVMQQLTAFTSRRRRWHTHLDRRWVQHDRCHLGGRRGWRRRRVVLHRSRRRRRHHVRVVRLGPRRSGRVFDLSPALVRPSWLDQRSARDPIREQHDERDLRRWAGGGRWRECRAGRGAPGRGGAGLSVACALHPARSSRTHPIDDGKQRNDYTTGGQARQATADARTHSLFSVIMASCMTRAHYVLLPSLLRSASGRLR